MRARLGFNRLSPLLLSLVFALAAAMVLGGTLAYVLKPPTLVPGRTQVLVIHDTLEPSPNSDACLWFNGHKHC